MDFSSESSFIPAAPDAHEDEPRHQRPEKLADEHAGIAERHHPELIADAPGDGAAERIAQPVESQQGQGQDKPPFNQPAKQLSDHIPALLLGDYCLAHCPVLVSASMISAGLS